MKRLHQLRNSVYIIFIFLVSVISVAAAMSYAKDAAYFGTPTNISIVNNSSDLRTATLNQAIAAYADTHDLVIIKRVYPKIDGKIIPKSYILGHQKQHMIGVPDASIEHRKNIADRDVLSDYGVFGKGNHQAFLAFLSKNNIQFMVYNPTALSAVVSDLTGQLAVSRLDILLVMILLVIVILNSFIIFKQRRQFVIQQLLKGQTKRTAVLTIWWSNIKVYVYAYLVGLPIIVGVLWLLLPEMLTYELIIVNVMLLLFFGAIAVSTLILTILFNRGQLVAVLKGRGKQILIPIVSCVILALTFMNFVTTLDLAQKENRQIDLIRQGQKKWEQIAHFSVLTMHTMSKQDDVQIKTSHLLLNQIDESQLLMSMFAPFQGPKITLGRDQPYERDIYVNPTYFKYQQVRSVTGKQLTVDDFHAPVTLLTTENLSPTQIQENYAIPNGIDVANIVIKKMQPTSTYVFLNATQEQSFAYQKPKHILVINFHAVQHDAIAQLDNSETVATEKPSQSIVQNLLPWLSQRNVMVNLASEENKNQVMTVLGPNIQDVSSTNKLRATLKQTYLLRKNVLLGSLILAILVVLLCGLFTIYIIFMAYRRSLFVKQVYGISFINRYRHIYLMLSCALLPGILYATSKPGVLITVIFVMSCLLLFFTYRIMVNERQSYLILKGEL